ncbi:MAG TPA: TetR/AcrR family transcriptional regulator [Motiliproteus sp.]
MGRPAAFDRELVVDQVTDLFWKKGYLGTSIADVVSATALKPGSIYNSFDSKQQLLMAALERYANESILRVRHSIQQNRQLQTALEQLLTDLITLAVDDPDAKGCLMLNIWLEMAAHDRVIAGYVEGIFTRIEAQIFEALEHAHTQGELRSDSDPRLLAKYLMMSIWGMQVMSRQRPPREVLEALVNQALMPIRAAFQ